MRRIFVIAVSALLVVALAGWGSAIAVEEKVGAALRRAGLSVRAVRFSWRGFLQLEGVARDAPGNGRLTIDRIDVGWRVLGGWHARGYVSSLGLRGLRFARRPLVASWPQADFAVDWRREDDGERAALRQLPGGAEIVVVRASATEDAAVTLTGLDLSTALVQWNGDPVLKPGRWSGRATLDRSASRFLSEGAFHAEAVRFTAPRSLQPGGDGAPSEMDLDWRARGEDGVVQIDRFAARLAGLHLLAHGTVGEAPEHPVSLVVNAHGDLADVFRSAGLPPPLKDARADRFGVVTLEANVHGPSAAPASLAIDSRLRFTPVPEVARALSYLRAAFLHRPDVSPGVVVDVRDGNRDFIPIGAVPPLFVATLLLSEDAGFWHHGGIDLAEIAAAWIENGENGRRLRGASTITQQLVKNLLLSSERTYGRKLNEAALAVMVDAVVPKPRLLEIYLNIIEWGPRLHGLFPAARHYFGKTPQDLTPREMAFLVCLIPNPVRYHQAHTAGRIGPGMEQLVRNLLAKVHAAGALDDAQYEEALHEELSFAPESPTLPASQLTRLDGGE